MSKPIEVTVVLATALQQSMRKVCLSLGATAQQAVEASGLLTLVAAEAGKPLVLGSHGRLMAADAVLCDGDRIELLQPLVIDPKESRRARVKAASRRRATVKA